MYMQIIYLIMYFRSFFNFAVVQLLCVIVCRASVNKDVCIMIPITLNSKKYYIVKIWLVIIHAEVVMNMYFNFAAMWISSSRRKVSNTMTRR